jgi:hypothetical protein
MKFHLFDTAGTGVWFWISILFFVLLIAQQSVAVNEVFGDHLGVSQALKSAGAGVVVPSVQVDIAEEMSALRGLTIASLVLTLLALGGFIWGAVEVNQIQAFNPFRGLNAGL